MYIFSDFRSAMRLALKARFLFMSFCVVVVLILATLLSAYFGGRQPATVALDVGISAIRLMVPFLIVLVVQELLSREFDRRYYLNSLTYPRPRSGLLLGRFAAVAILVLGLLLVLGGVQIGLVCFISAGYSQATPVDLGWPYLVVSAFIAVDFFVLTALAVFLSVVASTPNFVLIGTIGFMLVARSYGYIVDLLNNELGLVGDPESYRSGLGALGYLLPDLGALDMRALALYGEWGFLPVDWSWLLISSFGYIVALVALALFALQRKRFS